MSSLNKAAGYCKVFILFFHFIQSKVNWGKQLLHRLCVLLISLVKRNVRGLIIMEEAPCTSTV